MYGNCYTFNNGQNETILSTSMGGSEYGKEICTKEILGCSNGKHAGSRTIGDALGLPEMQAFPTGQKLGAQLFFLQCFHQHPYRFFPSLSESVFLFDISSLLLREQQGQPWGFFSQGNHLGLSL